MRRPPQPHVRGIKKHRGAGKQTTVQQKKIGLGQEKSLYKHSSRNVEGAKARPNLGTVQNTPTVKMGHSIGKGVRF